MKTVFMGTPNFAVPTLTKLNEDKDIEISYVVTKPDSKSDRGQKINFSDVKKKALELNLPILQPIKIKDDREVIDKIKKSEPDFIVVVAYGQILSKEILDIPRFSCINGHASLLPKFRGASPIQSAILFGEKITGTSTMLMDVGLDTGDILEQTTCEILDKETSDSLFEKLSELTATTLLHTIKNFKDIVPKKQDDSQSSKSVIIKKEDGRLDFKSETAKTIDRKIRAYTSWPSAYVDFAGGKIKIWDVDIVKSVDLTNAYKLTDDIFVVGKELYAVCKDSYLKINELQRNGKNRMKAIDFINGLRN